MRTLASINPGQNKTSFEYITPDQQPGSDVWGRVDPSGCLIFIFKTSFGLNADDPERCPYVSNLHHSSDIQNKTSFKYMSWRHPPK
jgi:hypothetical protein